MFLGKTEPLSQRVRGLRQFNRNHLDAVLVTVKNSLNDEVNSVSF